MSDEEGGKIDAGFVQWWRAYEGKRGVARPEKCMALDAWEAGQFSVLCYECAHPQIRHAPDTHYFYTLVCYEDADCPCQRDLTQEGEARERDQAEVP